MSKKESIPDWEALFLVFKQNVYPEMIELLAEQLSVSVDALNRLEVGWHPGEQAWVTREFDDRGNVVGLQKRYRDGKKFMVEGSKRGLVYERVGRIDKRRGFNNSNGFVRCYVAGVDCPLCGKRKWCMVSNDDPKRPSAIICGHTSEGAIKYIENSGFLHKPADSPHRFGNIILQNSDFPIIVVEGFSDVAAATNMGRVAIGRPNAESGLGYLTSLVKSKSVIVVGENDEAGQRGMAKTFAALRPVCRVIKKVLPPSNFKDLRQWCPSADAFDQWMKEQSEQADNSKLIDNINFGQLAEQWLANFGRPLIHYFGDWYWYNGTYYQRAGKNWLESKIRKNFQSYEVTKNYGKHVAAELLNVNTYFVGEIKAALECLCRTDETKRTDRPFWIGG